jgi:CubicO group peptidase (beta-lactamase class C family)
MLAVALATGASARNDFGVDVETAFRRTSAARQKPATFKSTSLEPTRQAPARTPVVEVRVPASQLPQLRSLLVSRRGELIAEYYAPGVRPGGVANIKSAAKSIIATLVGVAIHRGLVKGLNEPIATYFPELAQDPDPRKRTITIEDLLTMRSGLASTSGRNYGAWVQSPNWVRYALRRPMVSDPGTDMEYSTGTSHLLSAVLTKATGVSTWQFAQDALARPLGFSLARWPQDPQGIYFGGNEMLLAPKQMMALGELYRNRGTINGRQIVPAAWVDTSCVPRTASVYDSDRRYGFRRRDGVLRVGVRRPVHLRVPRPGPGGYRDVVYGRERGAAGASPTALRSHRGARPAAFAGDGRLTGGSTSRTPTGSIRTRTHTTASTAHRCRTPASGRAPRWLRRRQRSGW